jgi:2-C-methyl-D-erythritol 4-phosphate cytidylyltransferase
MPPAEPENLAPTDQWAIVVAGGSGSRFGARKQYVDLGGRSVLDRSVEVACRHAGGVVVVVPADDVDDQRAAFEHGGRRVVVVAGGDSRAASVRAGLAVVPASADVVFVHDAARPFASDELWLATATAVRHGADGAIPGVPVTDTIKVVEHGRVAATPPRDRLVAVQTPQAFRATMLRAAHASGADATDDAALVEDAGGTVVVVSGAPENRKITHPDDLDWARRLVDGAPT